MDPRTQFEALTKIHESAHSLVFRAREREGGRPVILKCLKHEHPSPARLARYQQEFEITRALELPEVIEAHALLREGKSLTMVLEDFGGESLARLLERQRFPLLEAIELGARIAEALAKIHERQVIHKDLNPANIVYARASDTLKLIDFGIATRLRQQTKAFLSPESIEGTLAYMSPEQTGRVNRQLDYRTDFYSLGVTLYELVCGEPPFRAQDPLELIHSHIARTPRPPEQLVEQLPAPLSRLLSTLMAKSADERYSSGWSVAKDLRALAQQLRAGSVSADFELSISEAPARFELPQKLYGREPQTRRLLEIYGATARGEAALVLVSGHSGSGKTSLVRELHRPVSLTRGHYCAGKFDQLRRIPFAALAQACSRLLHELLARDERELDRWRLRLQNTLRSDAQVLVDFVPELAAVIGAQAPAAELGAVESNRRMQRLLIAFFGLFCSASSPLVLFLDDVQWADTPTLDLLEHLVSEARLPHLLIVCAYRDNEVGPLHPLTKLRESLRERGRVVHELVSTDLEQGDILALLEDTLGLPASELRPLAELVKTKTGGNPFFVRQWLSSLYQEGLLRIVRADELALPSWQWDLDQLEQLSFADNIVELMLAKLARLPEQTRAALELAAFLGDRFDLRTLSLVAGVELERMGQDIQRAAEAGFVLPISEQVAVEGRDRSLSVLSLDYRFSHDRVQQAAYSLASEEQRVRNHSTIAQLLLSSLDEEAREQRLFEIVHHLNLGAEPADEQQHLLCAQVNLEAARRAKATTAFTASRDYINRASELIEHPALAARHELVMEVLILRVELESITANYELAEQVALRALELAQDVVERAQIQRLLIRQRTMLSQYEAAIEASLQTLEQLGERLPEEDLGEHFLADHAKIMARIEARGAGVVLELEPCTERERELSFSILASMISLSYQARPALQPVICTRIILSCFEHGLHPESVLGISAYGMILGAQFGRYELGYALGQVAFGIAERFNHNRTQLCRATNVTVGHVNHWARPFADNEAIVSRGFQAGVEVGEQEFASYILGLHGTNCLVAGERLDALAQRLSKYAEHVEHTQNEVAMLQVGAARLIVDDLRAGDSAEEDEARAVAERSFIAHAEASQSWLAVAQLEITRARTLYWLGRFDQAYELLSKAETRLPYITGLSVVPELHHYLGLSIIARALESGEALDAEAGQRLETLCSYMERIAESCAENFAHKHALLEAERAWLEGRPWAAARAYERASAGAANNNICDEALAHARASVFWAQHGNLRVSDLYLRESYQCFRAYGARRITAKLERERPRLFARLDSESSPSSSVSVTRTSTELGRALDLDAVLRASRAVSSSRDLASLVHAIMKIGLESAGAETGFLLLQREDELIAVARGCWREQAEIELLSSALDELDDELSGAIIQYVARTQEPLVLDDASAAGQFVSDAHVRRVRARSVLCLPLLSRGAVVAVLFMENRSFEAAFTAERLGVLSMLMTPAAVSLESAMLKASFEDSGFSYQVGGSLDAAAQSYVTRRADHSLARSLDSGEFCYVLCPRQMGKSSLRVRAMHRLRDRGTSCVTVDLSMIGSHTVSPEQWYAGVARALVKGLGLGRELSLRRWWREHDHLSAVQRLDALIEALLERVSAELVIFIDEVDSVLSLGFGPDDFFAMLRGLFNRRADDPRYRRLSVVLLGVMTPTELIRDASRTAFNLGRNVQLECFKPAECAPLLAGLATKSEQPELVLSAVLSWTSGQPFLTQRVCQLLCELPTRPRAKHEASWVGLAVRSQLIERWEQSDEPVHLRPIAERVTRSPRAELLLARYAEVLRRSGEVDARGDLLDAELLLTGLVVRAGGKLYLGCRIYQEVFDEAWIAAARQGSA